MQLTGVGTFYLVRIYLTSTLDALYLILNLIVKT